jgi:gliding motility-associated-like protein
MRRFFLKICFILLCLNANAQDANFLWAKSMGGLGYDEGRSVTVDAYGNVYATGVFQGTCDFDPGIGVYNLTASGTRDIFVCKIDASGSLVWAKSISGTGGWDFSYSVALDASRNVYLTGSFRDTVDFDPGPGVYNLVSTKYDAIFITKLDCSGNFIWAKTIGGNYLDIGLSITVDVLGNVYSTGRFALTVDFDPGPGVYNLITPGNNWIYISKLDSSGNFVWAKQFSGGSQENPSIEVDISGNVYLTGGYSGTVDFDPDSGVYNLPVSGTSFITKMNSDGALVWAKAFYGCASYSIVVDTLGNVYTTGYFNFTCDFDPGAGIYDLTSAGSGYNADIYISKLNASGNFVWAKRIGSNSVESAVSITNDSEGNVYTTGGFSSTTVDFDPDTGVYNLSPNDGRIFISKLDSSGSFVWAKNMGGSNALGWSIVTDMDGNVYVTGEYMYTSDFDPGSNIYNLTSEGIYDIVVLKLCQTPDLQTSIFGSASLLNGQAATFSTVETNADSYSWSLPSGWSGSSSTNTITAVPGSSGQITVTASNACGSSTKSMDITVNDAPIPNVFTPNGDGVNDEFKIGINADLTDQFHINIFDRWGKEVFSSTDLKFKWDGKTRSGEKADAGTYYYLIKVNESEIKGFVTLLE